MAPAGVPSAHMPRALSGQNLNEEGQYVQGMAKGNTPTYNPFLQPYDTTQRI